jgi:hypothetical protein
MSYLIIAGADENGQPSRCNTKETEAEAQALVDKLVNDMPEGKEAPNAFYVEDPGIDVVYIIADMATKTIVVDKAQRDSDTRDAAAAEVQSNRRSAYQSEADALFFEEQRGEVSAGTWGAKVDEIKARYPKE